MISEECEAIKLPMFTVCKRSNEHIKPELKENEMNTLETNKYTEERRSLQSALERAANIHEDNLREYYHLDKYRPKTPREVVELIKADKFEYDDEEMADNPDAFRWSSCHDHIIFKPGKANRSAYSSAVKKLEDEKKNIRLDISILEPIEGLKKVREFEKRTFH